MTSLLDYVVALFLIAGTFLTVVASIGIVRMPDLYLRMSAATKASTLGVGLLLVAMALYFRNLDAFSRGIAIIVFLFITNPVAAHRLVRAAYLTGVPRSEKTIVDELKEIDDL